MNQINIQYHKTKIGELLLGSFENKLCLLDYRFRKMRTTIDARLQKGLGADYVESDDAVLKQTRKQIDEYMSGNRQKFDLPLLTVGTDFQKTVWDALLNVPYGTTSSYQQLANKVNNKSAVRAVANANGANAMSIVIPCHRIIASDGGLGGYAGGLSVKKRLLQLENSLFA